MNTRTATSKAVILVRERLREMSTYVADTIYSNPEEAASLEYIKGCLNTCMEDIKPTGKTDRAQDIYAALTDPKVVFTVNGGENVPHHVLAATDHVNVYIKDAAILRDISQNGTSEESRDDQ